MLETALYHWSRGRSVFPTVGKRPKVQWKELRSRLPHPDELKGWFTSNTPRLEMGLVMGRVSGGIFAIEAQGREAALFLVRTALPSVMYCESANHLVAFYRYPEGCIFDSVQLRHKILKEIKINIRAEGGYIVIPSPNTIKTKWVLKPPGGGWANLPEWNPINFIRQFA